MKYKTLPRKLRRLYLHDILIMRSSEAFRGVAAEIEGDAVEEDDVQDEDKAE